MRELRALLRHAVEVGRLELRMPVAGEVAMAEIIGEDEDDIGTGSGGNERRGAENHEGAEAE
jgi:hypothetical protein